MKRHFRLNRFGLSFLLLLFCVSAFLFISCTTGKSIAFLDSQIIRTCEVDFFDAQVVIDQVPDKAVSEQLSTLAKNCLQSSIFNQSDQSVQSTQSAQPTQSNENTVYLSIFVNQRSFLQNASIKNAIFFNFIFTEKQTGRQVSVISEYTAGEDTVLSARVQHRYLNKALDAYFKEKTKKQK
ncbi:hypothetical protein HRI96_00765 [Treponema parvum]|uniref:Lipoprotein n=1 Tax=Treponema parvum TaxID=138851 RepID=A0A975EXJ0_9SPIR|nr:hypothetical protein [Treponema parvum]QTQ10850.1 hypothetical protein HRI96_00765 [Treponema parvum]